MKAHHTLILRIGRSFRLAVTQFLPAIVVSLIACTTHAASYVFTNIADSTGIFAPSGGPVGVGIGSGPLSINNNGTGAFRGGLDNGRVGVFTGPDPVADKVIASNEPLFGSTLVGVIPGTSQHSGAIDINDSGQIAFHYELADGRQGIAVATPTPASAATPTPTRAAAQAGVLAKGNFRDGAPGHTGRGRVEIQRLPDGSLNLLLADFSVTNGPDLYVVLSRGKDGSYGGNDLQLARLKANNGTQNYAIPAGTDVSGFESVLIWCKAFDVVFAYAPLAAAQ